MRKFYMVRDMEKVATNNNFRYERKLIVPKELHSDVFNLIKTHPYRFKEIFNERKINNIYFDTPEYYFYFCNLIGNQDRTKVRIRWYGDLFGYINPSLEFKKKYGQVGNKIIYKLDNFKFNRYTSRDEIKKIFFGAKSISRKIKSELKLLDITLINSYNRKYYLSIDNRFRITVDYKIEYFKLSGLNFLNQLSLYKDPNMILEIKYSCIDEDLVNQITNYFPFRLSKNSKYVNGIISTIY